ncbi:MAG: TIGR01777 family oxidoreductase, partial [Candidatus Eremiobacteraeota bacterium]|nr:TIGR01777 family oxidoreductase [Candidatus Eremiobacteraeota bacterium]
MKRIAVTGAGGFVGSALTAALRRSGYHVVALGRHPERFDFPNDVERRFFDADGRPDKNAFEGADAVIHLAGESVAGRWTDAKKRAIFDSRVLGTRNAIASCALCEKQPSTFICASATGFYGSREDEPLDENSSNGSDFLAGVCAAWEREARGATAIGMRSVQVRTGVALGHGGALEPMARPFRYGLGGPFGSGRQFLPWIHLDDLVRLYLFVLERDEIEGAINAVTPDYAPSARFSQALGAALQ